MAQAGRHGDHRRRLDHRGAPQEGRIRHARSHRGAETRRVQRGHPRHHHDDARGTQGDRTRQQVGRQVQEHVRTGHLFLALRPSGRLRQALPRYEICQKEPRHRPGQQTGHRRRVQLRGQHAPVRQQLHRSRRTPREGHLPLDLGQHRHGMGPLRRRREGRAAALLRLVPDHPGHGYPRGAGQAQGPRREDRTGRGRDRGNLHGHRCRLCR